MTDAQPNLPPTSRRLSAIHDLLLDIATALGALRENGRLTEARLDRHGERLASAEETITSHQQVISTWKASTPSPPPPSPLRTTMTTPPSMATSPTDSATATSSIWRRAVRAFTKEGLKELLPWIAGQIAPIAIRYGVPVAWAVWLYGKQALKWLELTWRGLLGG